MPRTHARILAGPPLRLLKRGALAVLAMVIASILTGLTYQGAVSVRDAHRYPPPGVMVPVDGDRALHALDEGPRSSPVTVVLEHGGTSMSSQWAYLQDALGQHVRTIAYDRAGMGWSDPLPAARTPQQMVSDLATLLDALDVRTPLVLVGHSYGGFVVRAFRDAYPDRVAGLVLLDASHPDQIERMGPEDGVAAFTRQAAAFPLLARLGLFRLMNPVDQQQAIALPAAEQAALKALAARPGHWSATLAELRAWHELTGTVRDAAPLGSTPLLVVTAEEHGFSLLGERIWAELQRELRTLSSASRQVVVRGAHHNGVATHPDQARAALRAVETFLATLPAQEGGVP